MTCFDTGWSSLLSSDLWADWGTVATPLVAVLAILFARLQIRTSREDSRRATAYSAYDNYLQLCFTYSEFGFGFDYSKEKDLNYVNMYKWFVAKMLFSFEQIVDVCKDDDTWKVTITHQLKRHADHLKKSSSVKRSEWSDELMKLIGNSISE